MRGEIEENERVFMHSYEELETREKNPTAAALLAGFSVPRRKLKRRRGGKKMAKSDP